MVGDGGALGAGLCGGAATAIDRQTTECVGGTASTMGLPSHEAEYATKTTREHEDGNRPLSRYHLPKEHYLGLLYTPKATINCSFFPILLPIIWLYAKNRLPLRRKNY